MAKTASKKQLKLHQSEDILNVMGLESHEEQETLARLRARGVVVEEPQTLGQIAQAFRAEWNDPFPGAA